MSLQYFIHLGPFVVATLIALWQVVRAWRSDVPENKVASAIFLAIAIWTLGTAFEVASPGLQAKVWWDRISFIGIVLLPPAWLLYVVQYTWQDKKLALRTVTLVSVFSSITLGVVFTNDLHHLLWTVNLSDITNTYIELPKTIGPGYPFFAIYSYSIVTSGIFILLHLLVRSRRMYRWQVIALVLACIIPLTINILENAGIINLPNIDLTAVLLALTLPIIVWAIRRLRFGDLVVVAWGTVTDKMSDAVFVLDSTNMIIDLNPAARNILKRSSSEVVAKRISDVWSDWIGFQERVPFDVERGIEIECEGDGKKIYDMRISPILNWRKRLVSKIIVLRDITELKISESKVRDTNLRLELALAELKEAQDTMIRQERLAAVGQLAQRMALEFNNALGPIVGSSEDMLKAARISSKNREKLKVIRNQAMYATELVEQLLDFSSSDLVGDEIIDIVTAMKGVVDTLRCLMPGNIRVTYNYNPEPCSIRLDHARLKQIFINLAMNAWDAMPDGGHLHIESSKLALHSNNPPPCAEMPAGEWAVLKVSDEGQGINVEHLPRVFEPFFTTRGVGERRGLGLAQVLGIVKQHSGYIDVASKVGEGTTFSMYFPLVKRQQDDLEKIRGT